MDSTRFTGLKEVQPDLMAMVEKEIHGKAAGLMGQVWFSRSVD